MKFHCCERVDEQPKSHYLTYAHESSYQSTLPGWNPVELREFTSGSTMVEFVNSLLGEILSPRNIGGSEPPFLRQRQAVHGVTPTCSNHLERLITAAAVGTELESGAFMHELKMADCGGGSRSGSAFLKSAASFQRANRHQPGSELDF